MTPRCRKPVFTFSPIDEPADDLVPHNSDALQLANMNLLQAQPAASAPEASPIVPPTEDLSTECPVPSSEKESSSSPSPLPAVTESEPSFLAEEEDKEEGEEEEEDEDEEEDDEEDSTSNSSSLSGIAPIQESRGDSTLTSPFKSYLMTREMQVFDGSVREDSVDPELEPGGEQQVGDDDDREEKELLDPERDVISNSLLEFLDGNTRTSSEASAAYSSPTRPSPPLTKSILFETSL